MRESVLASTMDLLKEGRLPTVEAVARQAGVQKTTIYRRWGTLEALVFDAVHAQAREEIPIPDTGDCREDLMAYLTAGLAFHRSVFGAVIVRLGVHVPEATRQAYWGPRLDAAAAIFERGKARREIRADVDVRFMTEVLLAPLYLRALVTAEPLDDDLPQRLTDVAMAAAASDR